MASKLFALDQTIALRTHRGERRLHFSKFHQILAILAIIILTLYLTLLSGNYIYRFLMPTNSAVLSENVRLEYEARIDALVNERDSLVSSLQESKTNTSKLIDNLGSQQEMLFSLERNNLEFSFNVNNLRKGLIKSQNELNALNLQIDAQNKQILALSKGENLGDNNTLSTITATLTETAIARDEARDESERLKAEIALAEEKRIAQDKKRDVLFRQIEDNVAASLTPLRSTLSKTGLNVDSLLNAVKQSYSGVGGVDVDASLSIFGDPKTDGPRVDKLMGNLETLSKLSFVLRSLPLGKPVLSGYRMSSGFGYRRHPITGRQKMHSGQDMAGPIGTPITAPGNGTVIFAGRLSGYGNAIKIQHPFGIETLYGHLSRILVTSGQSVELGQLIGKMGSTGASTGSHLHYEVKVNGNNVNPMRFLEASNYVQ